MFTNLPRIVQTSFYTVRYVGEVVGYWNRWIYTCMNTTALNAWVKYNNGRLLKACHCPLPGQPALLVVTSFQQFFCSNVFEFRSLVQHFFTFFAGCWGGRCAKESNVTRDGPGLETAVGGGLDWSVTACQAGICTSIPLYTSIPFAPPLLPPFLVCDTSILSPPSPIPPSSVPSIPSSTLCLGR